MEGSVKDGLSSKEKLQTTPNRDGQGQRPAKVPPKKLGKGEQKGTMC